MSALENVNDFLLSLSVAVANSKQTMLAKECILHSRAGNMPAFILAMHLCSAFNASNSKLIRGMEKSSLMMDI